MLRAEAQVEADEGEGTVQAAEIFVEHPAGELGIPVVDRGEDHEHRSTEDDVVEVGDNEVGVVHMNVEWHLCQGDPCDASEHEVHNEAA